MISPKALGRAIAYFRKRSLLTREELARRTNHTVGMVEAWETAHPGSLLTMNLIAEAMGITTSSLYDYAERIENNNAEPEPPEPTEVLWQTQTIP